MIKKFNNLMDFITRAYWANVFYGVNYPDVTPREAFYVMDLVKDWRDEA